MESLKRNSTDPEPICKSIFPGGFPQSKSARPDQITCENGHSGTLASLKKSQWDMKKLPHRIPRHFALSPMPGV
jgi:hypothetical protein